MSIKDPGGTHQVNCQVDNYWSEEYSQKNQKYIMSK